MTTADEPIPSPCIRNCCLNEEDVCVGCFRSLPEVVGWADADNATRQIILMDAKSRRAAHHERYKHVLG